MSENLHNLTSPICQKALFRVVYVKYVMLSSGFMRVYEKFVYSQKFVIS